MTLLVGRQEGHPGCKKTEWRGAGVVICLERGADLPLTVSCFSKIQIGFTFLVLAYLVSPQKKGRYNDRQTEAHPGECVCTCIGKTYTNQLLNGFHDLCRILLNCTDVVFLTVLYFCELVDINIRSVELR